jgi:hypothetical protein
MRIKKHTSVFRIFMIFAGNFAFTAEDMDIYEICLEKGNALCEDFKKQKIAMSTQKNDHNMLDFKKAEI